MSYYGDRTFVKCAEEEIRYERCSSLRICTLEDTNGFDYLQSFFPQDFLLVVSSLDESAIMLRDGACNVIAADRSVLLDLAASEDNSGPYELGSKTKTNEPLAIVTRNTDREFSDVVNWVLQALIYGAEQGLAMDVSRCSKVLYSTLTVPVSDLNYLNAVHCVGNYFEIMNYGAKSNPVWSQKNDSAAGMIYATPFGDVATPYGGEKLASATGEAVFGDIRNRGSLSCGVIVTENAEDALESASGLAGMSVDYCRALAAALFHGDSKAVKILYFAESKDVAYAALDGGTVDVLAGAEIEKKYDFADSESILQRRGAHFSTPFYVGNGTAR